MQRPGIREQISDDLEAFREIAEILAGHTEPFDVETMLEEFRKTLLKELDYRQEAQNMVTLGAALEEFDHIVVPQPVDDYTTTRVLTMDLISGKKVTSLSPADEARHRRQRPRRGALPGLSQADAPRRLLPRRPAPRERLFTDDRRIALLDLGMVARLTPELREQLLRLVIAVGEGRGDQAADEVEKIGEKLPNFDEKEMTRRVVELVGGFQHATVSDLQLGRIVMDISRLAVESGLKLPPELTMVGKTLLNLDEVGRTLDPAFDPNASIRRNSAELLARSLRQSATPGNVASSLLEAREFLGRLPRRVEKILDLVSTNSLRVEVDAIDERELIAGIQKIANRIALGLILAALIVGAALLTQVQTTFRIFGYPGLAMIFFLIAAGGGAALAASIVLSDRKLP